jgi:peroxiredoxin Q/BCP
MHQTCRSRCAASCAARVAALLIAAFAALPAPGCTRNESTGESAEATAQAPADDKNPEQSADQSPGQSAAAAAPAEQPTSLLAEGQDAPDFTAQAHDGSTIELGKLRGAPVVLYFYPKDETPGCTVEAQAFRDEQPEFEKLNARVIGVSLDSLDSHKAFADHHGLNFPLVADPGGEIAARYGVDTSRGVAARVTYVIDAGGKIAKVYPKVKVQGHADEVLAALQSLK